MYTNYYILLFYFPLNLFSSMLAFVSSSWFMFWMLMEFNLIIFIFILYNDYSMKNYILMNYFLIQAFSSFIYLFGVMMMYNMNFMIFFIMLALFVKLGIAPFHMWYLKMLNYMNWMSIFIISTLQKIIPLLTLNNLINLKMYEYNKYLIIYILLSMIWSSFMGLNQISVKMIMGFSSMIQVCWMMMLLFFNEKSMISYFLIYLLISYNLFYFFEEMNILLIKDLYNFKMLNKMKFYMMMLMMMSLSGIPPFFGFLMKWISIQSMYMLPFNFIFFMIITSLISMFFYLRFLYSSMLMFNYSKKSNFKFINLKFKFRWFPIFLNWIILSFLFMYEIY